MTLADTLATILEQCFPPPETYEEWLSMKHRPWIDDANALLDTPEGKALAALVDAAVSWRGHLRDPAILSHADCPERDRLLDAVDAHLAATSDYPRPDEDGAL